MDIISSQQVTQKTSKYFEISLKEILLFKTHSKTDASVPHYKHGICCLDLH